MDVNYNYLFDGHHYRNGHNSGSTEHTYTHQQDLLGKRALILADETNALTNLVQQLIQRGADIVLFCPHLSSETATAVSQFAQQKERNLYIIDKLEDSTADLVQFIEETLAQEGKPDIFIDIMNKKEAANFAHNGLNDDMSKWELTLSLLYNL